ncbi:hypothetical protein [Pedobacter sp. SYP-B3415]|uniref:hypothetical protein n=1 Tax=Pedobacter sp. SYP-B3415 TaxID=2496641 RepID=UPI00101D5379|nr:hypothetical protein [Pedobacter sp. SYP-B3415]
MKKSILFIITCLCAIAQMASTPGMSPGYTLCYVKEYLLKDGETEETHHLMITPPPGQDSLIIYSWTKSPASAEKTVYSIDNRNGLDSVAINGIVVRFLVPDKIQVNKDVYAVTTELFRYLKNELIGNRSILNFSYLLKAGLGDDEYGMGLLTNLNWSTSQKPQSYKIMQARIAHKSSQSEHVYNWTARFMYTPSGHLQSIKGDWINHLLTRETSHYLEYKVEREFDRGSALSFVRKTKSTLCDSVSTIFFQDATGKETAFTNYQSVPKSFRNLPKPADLPDAIRILQTRGLQL